jgi:formylglycine-generating enzyme required for sulfatase activity
MHFLVEERRQTVDDKTRQGHRLTDCLKLYFPQILSWFDDVTSPLVGDLLKRWPNLEQLQRAHPGTLRKFFRQHNCRSAEKDDGATFTLNAICNPENQKVRILCEAGQGLKAAHERGIVHRDVKPANIMRLADGCVKIMDFGIARALASEDTRLTQTGLVIGTPAYMAPEQFTGEGESDALCDVWAYGVVLYEFLTGTNPFYAPTLAQISYRLTTVVPPPLGDYVPGLPARLEEVMRRLLSKKREARYQRMEDVCFELETILLDLRQPEIDRLIAAAEEEIRARRLDEAQITVRRILDMDRSNASARKWRDEIQKLARKELMEHARRARDEAGAAACLEEALQLDPSNHEAQSRLSEIRASQECAECARGEESTRVLQQTAGLTLPPSTQSRAREIRLWLVIVSVLTVPPLAAWAWSTLSASYMAELMKPRKVRVTPTELSFAYQHGGVPPEPGIVEVAGEPADTVWTASASDSWFTVTPAQRIGDGAIRVRVDAARLAPGEYSGKATVSAKNGTVLPARVQIHLSVLSVSQPSKKPGAGIARADLPTQRRVNPFDGLTYVFIPPGRFTMGCSPEDPVCGDDEKPPRTEQIANGFWLAQTEVTQAAWKKVMRGDDPSHFKGDQLPVESVDWNQASAYCKAIGGRLPTEKEWEYAARAGTDAARYGSLEAVAWYRGNSGSTTHRVALKAANAFGLYDMLGNVWEWASTNATSNVLRGGCSLNRPSGVRASDRLVNGPSYRDNFVGFRCVGEFR